MKVMFVSYEFYPMANGTISCICNILPYLTEKTDVTVYCAKKGNPHKMTDREFGASIVRFSGYSDVLMCKKEELLREWYNRLLNGKKIAKPILFFSNCSELH